MDYQLIKNDMCSICLENTDVVLFETALDDGWGSVNIDHICICKKCFNKVLSSEIVKNEM